MSDLGNGNALRTRVEEAGAWFHSIDLGQGVVTPGLKPAELLAAELEALQLPDLTGKSVLDIGAYDGFFSFEAEKRGASRVVALDHYVWSMDLPGHYAYWRECKAKGLEMMPDDQSPHWQPSKLPGKVGFDTARAALQSTVEPVVGDFMTMDLTPLGKSDVVLFLGVLYHLENPLQSVRKLASVTRELAIIETHAISLPGYDDLELCEFYSGSQMNGDSSNWWAPNLKALTGMCQAAGFSRVDVVAKRPDVFSDQNTLYTRTKAGLRQLRRTSRGQSQEALYFRAIVHAWK